MNFIFRIVFFLLFYFFFACTDVSKRSREDDLLNIDIDSSSILLMYKTSCFSLPSPHQASLLIKNNDIPFRKDLMNSVNNYSRYSTTIKKALNLGIYGTDMGYLNIFGKNQDALTNFMVIEKLGHDLELSSAINENTLQRIETNLSNNDSILNIISSTYKEMDQYLIENNRDAIGILILAGGWIESMYILTQSQNENFSQVLVDNIGKQKYPLDKLIKLMAPYYEQSEEFTHLIDMLTDLAYEFDCLDVEYIYKKSDVYPEKKLTVINGHSSLQLNNYKISKILEKVALLRNNIISQ